MDYGTPRPYELLGLGLEDVIDFDPVPDNFGWDLTHDDEQEHQQEQVQEQEQQYVQEQVQAQVQDSGKAIVAPDVESCATREEQLPVNPYYPTLQSNFSLSSPLEQPLDEIWHGNWARPHQHSRHGTTGLLLSRLNEQHPHGPHGGRPSLARSYRSDCSITDTGTSGRASDTTALTVPSADGLGICTPLSSGVYSSFDMGSGSSIPQVQQLPHQGQQSSNTPFDYHHGQPHDALDNNHIPYVHQHETPRVQYRFEQEYHQSAPRNQPHQRRGGQKSRGPRGEIAGIPPGHLHSFPLALRDTPVAERPRPVAVACDYCKGRHKTCSGEFPCDQCLRKDQGQLNGRFAPNSEWRQSIAACLDEIASSKIGLFSLDNYSLHNLSNLSTWDDAGTGRFFQEYRGRHLSHEKMTAYVNLDSATRQPRMRRPPRLSEEQFLQATFSSPFARGLVAYANGTSLHLSRRTVAQWSSERLQAAKGIFDGHSSNCLSSDAKVKELYFLLQMISWQRYCTRQCKHILLCKQAYKLVLYGIADMALMPRSKPYMDKLQGKLENAMSSYICGERMGIFAQMGNSGNGPAMGLQSLIEEVKRSVAKELCVNEGTSDCIGA